MLKSLWRRVSRVAAIAAIVPALALAPAVAVHAHHGPTMRVSATKMDTLLSTLDFAATVTGGERDDALSFVRAYDVRGTFGVAGSLA